MRANNDTKRFFNYYMKYYIGGSIVSVIGMTAISLLVWFQSGSSFDLALLFHLFPVTWDIWDIWMRTFWYVDDDFRLPWNQQTLFGYIAELCFHEFYVVTYCMTASLILLFVCVTLHHQAMCKMFEHFLDQMDESDARTKLNICQLIKLHISAKKCVVK